MNAAVIVTPAVPATPASATSNKASPGAAPRPFGATRARQPFSIEWAAGFVDGEGCIHIARQSYRSGRTVTYRLRIQVYQNDYAVLEHFRDGLGVEARIYDVKRTAQHNKQVFSLMYDGKKAMAVISLLMPHLIRKQAEAQTAWAYWIHGLAGEHFSRNGLPPAIAALRERLYLKLRSLK